MSLFSELKGAADTAIEADGRWLICESAIVAENDDPDRRGRIKVVLPAIDENLIFNEWVVPAAMHCMGNGYGMLMLPRKGSEVLVSGVLGQKFNLIYHAAVYNEDNTVPPELGVDAAGIKTAIALKLISEALLKMQGQNVDLIATQLAKVQSNKFRVESGQEIELEAGTVCKINGASFEVSANGNLKIMGGNVQITGDSIKLFNRTVNQTGPSI